MDGKLGLTTAVYKQAYWNWTRNIFSFAIIIMLDDLYILDFFIWPYLHGIIQSDSFENLNYQLDMMFLYNSRLILIWYPLMIWNQSMFTEINFAFCDNLNQMKSPHYCQFFTLIYILIFILRNSYIYILFRNVKHVKKCFNYKF
jgi:hypothetical protein